MAAEVDLNWAEVVSQWEVPRCPADLKWSRVTVRRRSSWSVLDRGGVLPAVGGRLRTEAGSLEEMERHHEYHQDVRTGSCVQRAVDLRERTQQTIAALSAHDAAAFASFYGEDTVVEHTATPEQLRGRGAIQQEVERLLAGMPVMALQLQEFLVDGAVTAIRVLVVGANAGPLPMPTGDVPGCCCAIAGRGVKHAVLPSR